MIWLLASAVAGTVMVSPDIDVDVHDDFPIATPTSGRPVSRLVVHATVRNRDDRPHQVSLDLDGAPSRQVTVGPREQREVTLYGPTLGRTYSTSGTLTLTDLTLGETDMLWVSSLSEDTQQSALLGRSPEDEEEVPSLEGRLPDDWRGLAGFEEIAVTAAYLRSDERARGLLRDWVMAGGTLILEDEDRTAPEAVQRLLGTSLFAPDDLVPWESTYVVGLGRVMLASTNTTWPVSYTARSDDNAWRTARRASFDTLHSLADPPSLLLLVVLALFALLVGPVGWYRTVRRAHQPLVYVVVVLAGSAVFSGLILLATVLSDGTQTLGRSFTLRIIDAEHDRELRATEGVLFAPLVPGPIQPGLGGAAPLFELYWGAEDDLDTPGQEIDDVDAYVSTRSASWVSHWNVGPAQGRVVVGSGPTPTAENHLGADLAELWVWRDGQAWRAADVANGAPASFAPAELRPPRIPGVAARRFRDSIADFVDRESGWMAVGAPTKRADALLEGGHTWLDVASLSDEPPFVALGSL